MLFQIEGVDQPFDEGGGKFVIVRKPIFGPGVVLDAIEIVAVILKAVLEGLDMGCNVVLTRRSRQFPRQFVLAGELVFQSCGEFINNFCRPIRIAVIRVRGKPF